MSVPVDMAFALVALVWQEHLLVTGLIPSALQTQTASGSPGCVHACAGQELPGRSLG